LFSGVLGYCQVTYFIRAYLRASTNDQWLRFLMLHQPQITDTRNNPRQKDLSVIATGRFRDTGISEVVHSGSTYARRALPPNYKSSSTLINQRLYINRTGGSGILYQLAHLIYGSYGIVVVAIFNWQQYQFLMSRFCKPCLQHE
jgi:hypothetical protein